MKRNITAVPKETINLTNIADINASRAKTIMNTTSELWGKRIAIIPIDLFDVDYSYQRVRTMYVNRIYDNWDKQLCDCLVVSYRDDKFYIIDGQHRYYAAKAKGVEDLPCIVLSGLTKEDEARIFVKLNTSRKPLTPYDTYKANITCGNEEIPEVKVDMTIKRICEKYHVKVCCSTAKASPRIIRTLPGVRKYISPNINSGELFFDWFLKLITENQWSECSEAYNSIYISTLHAYYVDNLKDIDKATQKLVVMMSKYSPKEIMSYAKRKYSEYGNFAGVSNAVRELA